MIIMIIIIILCSLTPRSSGTSSLLSWMLRCSPGCPTERTMMTGQRQMGGEIGYMIVCLLFRYFNDPWQNLPKDGYTAMFENILLKDQKITVRLGMDYFK